MSCESIYETIILTVVLPDGQGLMNRCMPRFTESPPNTHACKHARTHAQSERDKSLSRQVAFRYNLSITSTSTYEWTQHNEDQTASFIYVLNFISCDKVLLGSGKMLVQLWQNWTSPEYALHANKSLVKIMIVQNLALRWMLNSSVAAAKLESMKHVQIKPFNFPSYIGNNHDWL